MLRVGLSSLLKLGGGGEGRNDVKSSSGCNEGKMSDEGEGSGYEASWI